MLWNFEDITMLVGSNMPIFGGGRFPAVSLRLRYGTAGFFVRLVITLAMMFNILRFNACLLSL